MAGGTWETQNKILPGVYIRFRSVPNMNLTAGERGIVTICEPLSWGPVARVMEITPDMDMTPYTGYDMTDSKNLFLQQIFLGSNRTAAPKKVLLYRPTASGSAQAAATMGALTATALYPGSRGNDISIMVTGLTEPEGGFEVSTIVAGETVDQQTASTIGELKNNAWVAFSGDGALAADAGTALTGGADGTVASAAYSAYLTAIEPYQFDIMIYDGADSTVIQALQGFVKRIAADAGAYSQLVAANQGNPDSRFVINVTSGVELQDGTELTPQQVCWWVGGAQAGARYNQSLTYAAYPGAVGVSNKLTTGQMSAAVQAGQLLLFAEDGAVKVLTDINSLVTYAPDMGRAFGKNRVMRLCNTIANDIYQRFSQNFIGVVNNNADGRGQFKAAIVGYLLDIQANQGIQNFVADDVQVMAGEAIDAIVVNLAVQPLDSVEKIYLTVELS